LTVGIAAAVGRACGPSRERSGDEDAVAGGAAGAGGAGGGAATTGGAGGIDGALGAAAASGSATGSGIVGALAGTGVGAAVGAAAGLLGGQLAPLAGRAGPVGAGPPATGGRAAMPGTDGRDELPAEGSGEPAFIVGIEGVGRAAIGGAPGVEGVPGPGCAELGAAGRMPPAGEGVDPGARGPAMGAGVWIIGGCCCCAAIDAAIAGAVLSGCVCMAARGPALIGLANVGRPAGSMGGGGCDSIGSWSSGMGSTSDAPSSGTSPTSSLGSRSADSSTRTKLPTKILSPARNGDGVMILRPLRYVPLVLFRSTTKNRPSWRTTRECRFDTLFPGKTISLPGTRPIVTSSLSNSISFEGPPFSLTTSLYIRALSPVLGI
jgi:hypothetical protein